MEEDKKDEEKIPESSETSVSLDNKPQPEDKSNKRTVKQIINEVLNCTVIQLPQSEQNENKSVTKVTVKDILGEILEYNVLDEVSTLDPFSIGSAETFYNGGPSTSRAVDVLVHSQNNTSNESILCACGPRNNEHALRRNDSVVPVPKRALPSYSSVMRQGPQENLKPTDSFIPKLPPPSYAEAEGIFYNDMVNTVSSDSVIFGPDPLHLICPVCRVIVTTEIDRERTGFSHWVALILCIFLCWPCCLLPYYMKSCSYTYHTCPNCQHYFGMYNPF
ncbi:uncharacterized protein LOC126880701 [Diabrotica virgifera virgifera]|uniref:LITAF domain-containing protein n=1 Tax=Diabrotica virgifera virgifera TaxID=50390 RepID=A0ABM5JRY2_DIAVI|nr:uncharacterized protein LOC126880701 [Diabrotica virgifera virgifera]